MYYINKIKLLQLPNIMLKDILLESCLLNLRKSYILLQYSNLVKYSEDASLIYHFLASLPPPSERKILKTSYHIFLCSVQM